MTRLVALDLATNTGVAVGDTHGAPIASHERLGEAGSSHAARFSQMLRFTDLLIKRHKPDLIAIEQPVAAGVIGGEERVQLAMGWRAVVFTVAYRRGIRCVEYPVSSIRSHFLGGGVPKGQGKKLTMQRCARLGWKAADDNEADALALWDFARMKLGADCTPPAFGLFDHDRSEPR